MKSLFVSASFFLGGVGLAATDADPVGDLLRSILQALSGGQYALGVTVALILAVKLVRDFVPRDSAAGKWLAGDMGGTALVALVGFLSALSAKLAMGGAFSLGLLWAALQAGFAVAAGTGGTYALIRRLLLPLLAKLPMPAWLKALLNSALWMFAKPGEDALKRATAAGAAAGTGGVGPTGSVP